MTEHHSPEPPAQYRYAVGAGLGLLIGAGVGVVSDNFLPAVALGLVIGIAVAYLVKFLRP